MTEPLIALFDFVGFLGFAFALLYSYKNFQKTKQISSVWLLLTISMVFLALFNFLSFLQWSNVYPETMDEMKDAMLMIGVVGIFTSVIVSQQDFLKPVTR